MSSPNIYHLLFALTLLISTTLFLRLLTILPSILPRPPSKPTSSQPTHLMIILGSGGHTAEMLSMLRNLSPQRYHHRTYIISSGDSFSALKAQTFESTLSSQHPKDSGTYTIRMIPRARKIHQSLLTTPFTSLYTLFVALKILTTGSIENLGGVKKRETSLYPNLILTNGPATGVLVIVASLLLKYVNWKGAWTSGRMRTIYVESWARCRTLSLSGRILVGIVDRFLVQWEGLKGVGGRGEFRGVLVE